MFLSTVCSACYVFDSVGELFVECVCYRLVCGGCFVAEGGSAVVCLGSVFLFTSTCILYSSPQCMRVLFVVHLLFRCSFHIFVLCCCMRDVIPMFKPFSM